MQVIDKTVVTGRDPERTAMFVEAADAAAVVSRQITKNQSVVREVVTYLLQHQPNAVITCARGSSDHASTFMKYLIESQMGIITSSAAPSIQSIYETEQVLRDTLFVSVSQSGRSPDLLENARRAKSAGATVLTMVNDTESPIVELADFVIPLHAGVETSVAATKSYIATLSAMLHLVSEWSAKPTLKLALESLPDGLQEAWNLDWRDAGHALADERNLYVIARGLGLGVAQEAALKLKEVCGLHAEAFSGAEVRHGPMALVNDGFPVLMFAQEDETRPELDRLVVDLRAHGAKLMLAAENAAADIALPVALGFHRVIQPILMIQTFYRMSIELAIIRGYDPDRPPNLSKITRTI